MLKIYFTFLQGFIYHTPKSSAPHRVVTIFSYGDFSNCSELTIHQQKEGELDSEI